MPDLHKKQLIALLMGLELTSVETFLDSPPEAFFELGKSIAQTGKTARHLIEMMTPIVEKSIGNDLLQEGEGKTRH